MKNIFIVGGLHGDEPTGITVAKYLLHNPQNGIESIVAHPQAAAENKRFFETDLNRSFSPHLPISFEEQLAVELKRQLYPFDFLIDLHNTKGDFTTCAITVMEPTNEHKVLARHFGFKRLVIMPPSGSLIGLHPEKSISFEIALNETDYFTTDYLVDKIKTVREMSSYDDGLTYYKYVQSIKSATAKRVGITPESIVNFKDFTIKQKELLDLPMHKSYCAMFSKKQFNREVAFELLEKLV